MSKIRQVYNFMRMPSKVLEERMRGVILGNNCTFSNTKGIKLNEQLSEILNCRDMSTLDNFAKHEDTFIHFSPYTENSLSITVKRGEYKPQIGNIVMVKGEKTSDFMHKMYEKIEELMLVKTMGVKTGTKKSLVQEIISRIGQSAQAFKMSTIEKYLATKGDNKLKQALSNAYYPELHR
ncbi:hypothetical protein IJ596_08755 [bacterium]|nr:hypothetical protein [bacterium]